MIKKITAAVLSVVLLAVCLVSCGKTVKDKDARPLSIGVGALSGNVIPYGGMTDGDTVLCDMVYSKLVSADSDGSVLCGSSAPTAALDFRMFYADKAFVESAEPSEYTAFEFILKNGMKFSDGSDMTAEDVLFSLYYYLDPRFADEEFSALPVAGLENYIYQRGDMEDFRSVCAEIAAKGSAYVPTESDSFTKEQAEIFWKCFDEAGERFASDIVKYVSENYCTDELISAYVLNQYTCADMKENSGLMTAYAMMLWNYGSFVYTYEPDENGEFVASVNEDGSYSYRTTYKKAMEDETYISYVEDDSGSYYYDRTLGAYLEAADGGEYGRLYSKVLSSRFTRVSRQSVTGFRDTEGKSYTLSGDSFPSTADFFAVIKDYYTESGVVDYQRLEATEAPYKDDTVYDSAARAFAEILSKSTAQPYIKGVARGTSNVDGVEYENITIYLEGGSYDSVESMDIYIMSKAHMTAGYEYDESRPAAYGMPLDSESFAEHVKSIAATLGGGPYVLSGFSEDGAAELTLNTNFYTMGDDSVYNPQIERVEIIQVPSGEEAQMTKSGQVDVCLVPAADADGALSVSSALPLYDCVVVNPAHYINLYARRALFSLMDVSYAGDALLSCCMPYFLWAYIGGEAEIQYDSTLEKARSLFSEAGYTFSENGEMIDPATKEKAHFVFTLLPTEDSSDIYNMFDKAAEHLRTLGASAEVVFDSDLMYSINSEDGVAIYSVGWDIQSGTGMFGRYAVSSDSEAVRANGIKALADNGLLDNFGTVDVTADDGTVKTLDESDAVAYLDSLILQGNKATTIEEKRRIYNQALTLINDLHFELPLTCRTKQVLISSDIDADSLYKNPTCFRSVISEIWKIRFAEPDASSAAGEASGES